MKYICEIIIDAPIKHVTSIFANHDHLKAWQPGLVNVEKVKGDKVNYRLIFKMGKQEMVMKETIEKLSLPNTYIAIYQMPGVWNRCVNQFEASGDQTLWTMESEFQFEKENHLPQDHFEQKTLSGMKLFKTYVESMENTYA